MPKRIPMIDYTDPEHPKRLMMYSLDAREAMNRPGCKLRPGNERTSAILRRRRRIIRPEDLYEQVEFDPEFDEATPDPQVTAQSADPALRDATTGSETRGGPARDAEAEEARKRADLDAEERRAREDVEANTRRLKADEEAAEAREQADAEATERREADNVAAAEAREPKGKSGKRDKAA